MGEFTPDSFDPLDVGTEQARDALSVSDRERAGKSLAVHLENHLRDRFDSARGPVFAGRTFQFQDDTDDVWGEVSAGVNFFNFTETTSVFAKVDVTFENDISGVGGKAGMRVAS